MIDVIIPTYQPDLFFIECFESLQKQTLPFDKFKVTIVLNGDKEPYYSHIKLALDGFSFDYSLIYTDEKGVSNARNLGVDKTSNPYIIFLDDDDLLTENYLEQLLLLAEPSSIVVSNVLSFKESKENPIRDYLSFENSFQSNDLIKYRRYLSNSCCKLISRELIRDAKFDSNLFKGEDALFMFTLSPRVLKIISTAPDVIYFRRIRPYSASRIKYSIFKEVEIGLQQQWRYTALYMQNISKYSFALYMSRILAVFKVILMKMKG